MSAYHMLSLKMDDTQIGLVTSVEAPTSSPKAFEPPAHTIHCHNVFEYHYLYEGTFQMICNNVCLTLNPGQILIISPEIFHYYENYSPDLATMICQFTLEAIPGRKGTLYDKFASTFLAEEGYCILDADRDLFARLQKLQMAGNIYEDNAVRLRAIMEMIFLDLCRPISQSVKLPMPDNDDFVRSYAISEYVASHFAEDITADDMASHLSISRRQLFRCLKDTMHTTWVQLLTKQRIRYAIQLLGEGVPPSQAASLCGFNSYNGFAKAFIREQGMTPGEYLQKECAQPKR